MAASRISLHKARVRASLGGGSSESDRRAALRESLTYEREFEKLQQDLLKSQEALFASIPEPRPVAPPATAGSSSVQEAADARRRDLLRRRGYSQTTFAGETGGFGLGSGLN